MAASVNPILPSKQPLKILNRSPKFLRNGYNMKNNAAKRKSAVELLQESKAYYVKSEQVLDTKQELKHTEHLQVTSHPSYNNLLRHPLRTSHGWDAAPSSSSSSSTALPPRRSEHKASGAGIEPKLLTVTLLGSSPRLHIHRNSTGSDSFRISAGQVASGSTTSKVVTVASVSVNVPTTTSPSLASVAIRRQVSRSVSSAGQSGIIQHAMCQQQQLQRPASQLGIGQESSQPKNVLPPKSPRAPHLRSKTQPEMPCPPPRPHEYRRSHSEKDNTNDIQMKLRRLLNTDSKENLNTSLHSDAGSNHILNNNRLANGEYRLEPLHIVGNTEVPRVSDFCNNQEEPFIKPRHQQEGNYCIHKSMPDLSPMQVGLMRRLSANGSDDDSLHLRAPKSLAVKPPSWTTSDYVSRSPSSRKECFSEKAADQLEDISGKLGRSEGRMDEDDDSITAMDCRLAHVIEPGGDLVAGIRRRPILRSKSDISHRYSKSGTDLSNTGSPKRNSRAGAELERFFDTMGLDSSILYVLKTPPSDSSSPIFFNSVSTGNSSCCCHGGATCEGSYRGSCDPDEESNANAVTNTASATGISAPPKDGITSKDLILHGPMETSIVERNARVIKWLFNCRKIQSSGETAIVKRQET